VDTIELASSRLINNHSVIDTVLEGFVCASISWYSTAVTVCLL